MNYRNLVELHRKQTARLGPNVALRFKRDGLYQDLSWDAYREMALACASALIEVGIQPGDRVATFSENRFEWLITDIGILTAGAVNVTPHAPLTAHQVHYELDDSDASWIFVSTSSQREKIEQIRQDLPDLEGGVVFDADARTGGFQSWRAFLQRGRNALSKNREELTKREANLDHDSLATLMYTSGTTGQPKGVMLTHGNLLSNTWSTLQISHAGPGDVMLNWLPFSHIYARTVDHYRGIYAGIPIALAESAEALVQNLAEIEPTQISSVPRFYEKVLTLVQSDDEEKTHRRLRNIFGRRMDYLSSGGAPLPPAIAQVYHDAGLLVLQGYGLTESSPVISFNQKEDFRIETVGRPIPGIEVKIAEDGEVLTKGPHVMKGYWKKPEETAATIVDGWLHTGDLGSLDDGFLSITGRKKELMVLSNGKEVVPALLENRIVSDPCIDQVVICGEARNYLTALVVPDWPQVRAALEVEETEESVYALLEERIQKALADVANWEQVKKFIVLEKPFTVEAEELTVSLKLRRGIILKRYQEQLDALYTS